MPELRQRLVDLDPRTIQTTQGRVRRQRMARRKRQRFRQCLALLRAEFLLGDAQGRDLQERRCGFVPARGGVFDRHAVLAQLYAEIEAGLGRLQMALHRFAQVRLARGSRHGAAVARGGDQRIFHGAALAEAVGRGAPVTDVQRRCRADAQRGEAQQRAHMAAQYGFRGEQHHRAFDGVVHRVAEQGDGAQRHRRRAQQHEVLAQRGFVLARGARRHQLDRQAARIGDRVGLRLAAGVGSADPALVGLRLGEQPDAQMLRQIGLHLETTAQQTGGLRVRIATGVALVVIARHLAAQDVDHLGRHRRFVGFARVQRAVHRFARRALACLR